MTRRCAWTGPRTNHHRTEPTAGRLRLVPRREASVRLSASSQIASSRFSGQPCWTQSSPAYCEISAVPGENDQAVGQQPMRGVLPCRRPQAPRFGKGQARGNSGWGKAPWSRSRRSRIVEP
jgi:hypothetical protein